MHHRLADLWRSNCASVSDRPRVGAQQSGAPVFQFPNLVMLIMLSRFRHSLILFVASVVFSWFSAALAEARAFGLDDLLHMEGLGAAEADPRGKWMMFEKIRPYDEITDYSFRTYAYQKSGHQIWRYDLRGGGEPERLPGLDPEPHTYLQGFSASGKYLLLMQYHSGALSMLAYEMNSETVRAFEKTPAFSRSGEHNPVWISDTAFVFAALPDGDLPATTSVRARTGKALAEGWKDAWSGEAATAVEVRTYAEDQSNQPEAGELIVADADTGRVEVLADGLYADLRVSPDQRWLAGLAVSKPRPADPDQLLVREPRRYKLVVFNLETRQEVHLAENLEFYPYTITWSPDGRRLTAYGWERDKDAAEGRFHVIDIAAGSVTRYDHPGLDLVSERERGWRQRPERALFIGDRLAVFARRAAAGSDPAGTFTDRNFMQTGLARADWYTLAVDGKVHNLTASLSDVSGIPVHAGPGHVTLKAADGVYRFYRDGGMRRLGPDLDGQLQLLTPGTFATRSSVIRPEFSTEALFSVNGAGGARILMLDLREDQNVSPILIDAPDSQASPLAGSLAAGSVLFRTENGPQSHLFLARSGPQQRPKEIMRINSHMAGLDFGEWRILSYNLSDPEGLLKNQTVESCILLPPNFDPQAPPPLIVDIYPDIGPSCRKAGPQLAYPDPDSPYVWASKGYAYARLTTPRELIRTEEGPIAGMDEVIGAGVDAILKDRLADPERIALYGFSQGGVSALYVAAHSDRYKAVIAANSWADLFSNYFGSAGVYSYLYGSFGAFGRYDATSGSDFGIGRTPFQDPEFYYRNSPVFLAPQIDIPVLLLHSDMDEFSMSQFDEMYGALLRAGKDARYVRYWGEGHGPSGRANIRDMWERFDQFLSDTHVAPENGTMPACQACR